ncbi:hypothetical protein DM02DRAFT_733657 [Periconia macrospinosa]|uniref:Uncharacterized protein n=1 Tax=Periconia macrospinosa TaxID=97972 RepID=A0A2V1D4D0_9PLEO|nr:hypothetical protein DM02DRAFT_733657 [Periconia macrospinosa]
MFASLKGVMIASLFATASLAAVQAEPSNFKLYAYTGRTIGGSPIFYADGLAYAGANSSLANANEVTGVNFTASSDGTWTATPESNVTWSSKVLYISNTTGEVGFTNKGNSSSNIITSGFRFYDHNALLKAGSKMEASWRVKDAGNTVWGLAWGTDDDDSFVPIMLRNVAPVTNASKTE